MKLIRYTTDDFSGGFSAASSEITMKNGFSAQAYNVEALDGKLRTMKGCSLKVETHINYRGQVFTPKKLMVYRSESVDNEELLVWAEGRGSLSIFRYTGSGWENVDNNYSNADVGYMNQFFNGQNNLILASSEDGMFIYDGNETEEIDICPMAGSLTLHFERLWAVGDPGNPNTVYYSAEGNPTQWDKDNSDAGEIMITTFDGDRFIGIENVFDDVVLYRHNSLFRISGSNPSSYRLQQIQASTGAVGTKGIANDGKYSFYIGNNGIYRFDGMKAYLLENDRLREFFAKDVNKTALSEASAIINGNTLYVALPTGMSAFNDTVIEYDIIRGVFNIRKNVDITEFAVYRNELIFIDTLGNICIYNSGDAYKGECIDARYETPVCEFDGKNVNRTLDSVYFCGTGNGKIVISCITENGTRSVEVRLSRDEKMYRVPLWNSGRRFKFVLENCNGSWFEITNPEFFLEEDDAD